MLHQVIWTRAATQNNIKVWNFFFFFLKKQIWVESKHNDCVLTRGSQRCCTFPQNPDRPGSTAQHLLECSRVNSLRLRHGLDALTSFWRLRRQVWVWSVEPIGSRGNDWLQLRYKKPPHPAETKPQAASRRLECVYLDISQRSLSEKMETHRLLISLD